jgi:hypothetical protein
MEHKIKVMKTLIIKTSFFILLLFMMGAGCKKYDKYEVISLEYVKCPCNLEMSFIKEVTMDKILLFDTTKIAISEMQTLSLNGESSIFVCYNPERNNAIIYSYQRLYRGIGIGYICNFPETAREWEIPLNGIYISFSADAFESSRAQGSIGFLVFYSDNVLTSLKKFNR